MPKARSPNADKAEQLYRTGKKLIDISKELGVPAGTIRRWKSTYQWDNEQCERSEKANEPNANVTPTAEEVKQVMENPDLTDKQRLFCLHYVRCFNATRSYLKAYGCSYGTAAVEGSTALKNPKIREEIQRLKQNRLNREMLEPSDIFQKFMDIAFADMADYVSWGREESERENEHGETITTRKNVVRLKDSEEVDGTLITEVSQGREGVKIKRADQMKALVWLADHMDMATEEQRARIDKLKADTARIRGDDPDEQSENDGFMDALKGEAAEVWQGE